MIINRANYESYLLDYLEGNLPAELLVEMEMFLSQNLDIAAQIDNPNLPKIVPEDFPIPDFTNLVKPVNWNVSEVEILLINSIENQLEKSDLKRLAQYKKAFPNKFIELEGVLKNTQLSAPDLALGGSIKEELKMVDEQL